MTTYAVFASVGIGLSVTSIGSSVSSLFLTLVVLLATFCAKLAGATGAARMAGLPCGEAIRVGALMNCRGVTELVVATIE